MCNKTEDMKLFYNKGHICPYCDSLFSEVIDLIAHIKDTHENRKNG